MAQPWQQGQPGYPYTFQTGIPPTFQQQPQPGFGGGIQAQPTGFPNRAQPAFGQQQSSNFQLQPTGFQQPQPTGFQQSQPTGFQGLGGVGSQGPNFVAGANFQQRAAPPVPPIPSRFQVQPSLPPPVPPIPPAGSTFLSTTTQSRLIPQQTGFVPQGGSAPLVPQVTGYVDPRLQAINTAFMPASVPYSASGFPQFAQSSQGFNLQQSIQQINQSRATNANASRVSWALSKAEKKQYDQIFRAWDTSGSGFISGETALQVFGASGLDKNDLARIWSLADINDQGRLSLAEFHVAMGLIYRRLNGSEIPEQLPPELVPPSQKDLDSSVDFVKDLLSKDSRSSGPPSRSFGGNTSENAHTRKDGTIYKYNDEGEFSGYKSTNRHLDRRTVRTGNESPSSDLSEMRRQLENASKLLDKASSESASRTAEDDALDKELEDLKYRVRRVQDDLEYVSRGPKSFSKDEERRKLERDLLHLMHTRLPELEKKIEERDRRKAREKEDWARSRDRANDKYSRFEDDGYSSRRDRQRDEEYNRGYLRGTFDSDDRRPSSRNNERDYDSRNRDKERDRDRDRDRDYDRYRDRDRDRDRDYDRGSSYRDRDRGYDRDRDGERDKSLDQTRVRSPPAPPAPPAATTARPAPPAPSASPLPTKNMTAEERRAYYQDEASRLIEARKRALGVATPGPSPTPAIDSSVQDRIASERKEAEEKAKRAEMELEERERSRQQRLQNAKEATEPKSSPIPTPPAVVSTPPVPAPILASRTKAPAPPPPVRKAATRPPVTPRTSSGATAPPAPPAFSPSIPVVSKQSSAPIIPEIDPEEEKLRMREEAIKKEREARAARLRQLEAEEQEERRKEEEYNARRLAFSEAKAAASRAQVAASTPPAPPAPVSSRTRAPPPPAPSRNGSAVTLPPPIPSLSSVASPAAPAPVPPVEASPASSPVISRTNPFNRLLSQDSNGSPTSTVPSGGTNPFARAQQPAAIATPVPPPSKVYPVASTETDEEDWADIKDMPDEESDDEELDRKKFSDLAESIFRGGPVSPSPPVPSPAPAKVTSPVIPPAPFALSALGGSEALDAPPPPPPPGPPPPPPASTGAPRAPVNGTSGSDRGALFSQIASGAPKLRKTVTNDRSAAAGAGIVLGDVAPPAHVGVASPSSPPSTSFSPEVSSYSEASSYTNASFSQPPISAVQVPATVREEDESTEEFSVISASVPAIQVNAPIGEPDILEDIDLQTEYRVRSLYPYQGQREADLVFEENLIIRAHPSKSNGPWWYGTIARNGKKGFFPNTYVQQLENVKAKTLYAYQAGNADELPFSEGEELTIIDRSEGDWWKTERDGMVFIVPAAYLEVIEVNENPGSVNSKYDAVSLPSPVSPMTAGNDEDSSRTEKEDSSSDDTESSSEESDIDNDQVPRSEEEVLREREARQSERMRVLEAAGIIVKEDSKGRPPPPVRRKSSRKYRPTPPRPSRSSNARDSVTSITSSLDFHPLPPVPDEAQSMDSAKPPLDDAYERYQAFKQQLDQRASIISYDSIIPSSPDTVTSGSPKPQESKGRHSALLSFLGRKTPANDNEKRSASSLVISGPILSGSGAISRDNSPVFGSSWSSLVDKGALEGIPDSERRRQEAIFELVMTENAYVRDLQLIVETFCASLMTKLDPKAITVIFANVEDVLLTNTTFLSSLEERQKHCRLYVDNIGDIIESNMARMGLYMQYCVNTGNAIKFLQSLRDSRPEIAAHLQHLRDDPGVRGLDLSSYLLTPMQRITRYPLLIRQIIHYTHDQRELKWLESGVTDIERILDAINEAIRSNESTERLRQISSNFWIEQGRLDLTQPTRYLGPRKLLKEGPLFKAKSGKKLHGILCNDILILAEDSARALYRMPIPLSALRVEEIPGRNDTDFKLALAYPRGGEAINLRATSARDAQNWIKFIEQSRDKCINAAEKRIPTY